MLELDPGYVAVPVGEVSTEVVVGNVSVWSMGVVWEEPGTVIVLVSVDRSVVVVVSSEEDWEVVP